MQNSQVRETWQDGARYPFSAIEKKWQARWEADQTFRTVDDPDESQPKFYALVMFPYTSGSGLHVGHMESYTAADILARYKRMNGFRVLHPMGWDAFGLPAEQHAVRTGTHPRMTTEQNVNRFRDQIKTLGLSYDWAREINTTDPDYFRWTQWIFLKIFDAWYDEDANRARPIEELPIPDDIAAAGEIAVGRFRDSRRLAYQADVPVNWCSELGTVLANEEVIDGKSEIGGHPVQKLPLRQWMLRITAYSDRLLADLELVDWPEPLKIMQRNWIGKSEGADIDFPSASIGLGERSELPADIPEHVVRVYTTRPDTIFGVTFMVLSPEHPLVDHFTSPANQEAVDRYRDEASRKTEIERTDLAKEKTGVDTGGFCLNPVTGEKVPVWIADYVLMSYGTGAIMAVPGHDVRDFEFAEAQGIEVRPILGLVGEPIAPGEDPPGATYMRSAAETVTLDGLDVSAGKKRIVEWLESSGWGRAASNTKLRDWLFSRQRYWGEPIPLLHGPDGELVAVPSSELPLELPELDDYKPTGEPESPLAKAGDWLRVTDDVTGKEYLRETNTMPQWAGSCWYYLRYIDPENTELPLDPAKEKAWMPVDVYIGGAEHAVLHLLYARFWHKVLFDLGVVSTPEPFQRLMNQGMILGEDGNKMSKSVGNVINPDEVVRDLGADALRLYEMFMGPLEVDKPWSTQGIQGISRFLDRVWRAVQLPDPAAGDPHERLRHRTIRKVTHDIDKVRLNTAIAALMEYVNAMTKGECATAEDRRVLTLLLSPFAPHLGEELWSRIGHDESLAYEPWPTFDADLARAETLTIVVQINGKVRAKLEAEPGTNREELEAMARADETVQRHLDGEPRKVIVVPDRLVNFVR